MDHFDQKATDNNNKKQSGVGGFKFVLQLIYESPLTCKVK